MKTRSTQFDLLAEMCQYSTWRICVWLFPHIDNKIQIYLILFNTFDKLVAKFDKFALICIRFSPTFMKQFKQYSFDDSNKIHSIIEEIVIRWFDQNSFDNSSNIHSMIRAKLIRWCTWPFFHIRIESLATEFSIMAEQILNGSLWRLACSIYWINVK